MTQIVNLATQIKIILQELGINWETEVLGVPNNANETWGPSKYDYSGSVATLLESMIGLEDKLLKNLANSQLSQAAKIETSQLSKGLANAWRLVSSTIVPSNDYELAVQKMAPSVIEHYDNISKMSLTSIARELSQAEIRTFASESVAQIGAAVGLWELFDKWNEGNSWDIGKTSVGVLTGTGASVLASDFLIAAGLSGGLPILGMVLAGYAAAKFAEAAWKTLVPSDYTVHFSWDSVFETVAQLFNAAASAPRRDPLTIDLDADGIESSGLSTVMFDQTGHGVKTVTGWIKPDDGLLVLDRNGNGTIDNGLELFGDSTRMSNGQLAKNGFEALADLDTNHDGVIDANDAQFANLRIWQDLNQDGLSQANELFTLTEKGILSLNVTSTNNLQSLTNGNELANLGVFTKLDGTAGVLGSLADVNLTQDTFHSQFTDSITLTDSALHLPQIQGAGEVRSLRESASLSPTLDTLLHNFANATSHNAQLAMVDSIINEWANTSAMKSTFDGAYQQHALTVTMDGIATNSDQYNRIAHELTILEKFNGRTFREVPNDTSAVTVNIVSTAQTLLDSGYQALKESVFQSLSLQTRLTSMLDLIALNIDSTGINLDFSALDTELTSRLNSNGLDGFADFIDFNVMTKSMLVNTTWDGNQKIADYVNSHALTTDMKQILSQNHVLWIDTPTLNYYATNNDDVITGQSANEVIFGGNGNDVIYGGSGNDRLEGDAGNDTLYGGTGDDYINGADGNDVIDGGSGNDSLAGGAGTDVYMFKRGSGQDVINSALNDYWNGSVDKLQLGEGIASSDLILTRNGNNLIMMIANTTDQVTFLNYFSASGEQTHIRFADGTEWGITQITPLLSTVGGDAADNIYGIANQANNINGMAGNDHIIGGALNDILNGNIGADNLEGGAGNDTLIGGKDNDILTGGLGSDIYVFNRGDGQDVINNAATDTGTAGVVDTLLFGAGISKADLSVIRSSNDLILSFNDGSTDKITISSHFYSSGRAISQVQFSDGSVLSQSDLSNMAVYNGSESADSLYGLSTQQNHINGLGGNDRIVGGTLNDVINGGAGADNIDGGAGNDTLIGGTGNDILTGGLGSDVFIFHLGDGQDIINNISPDANTNKVDSLKFEDLISSEQIWFSKVGNDLSISIDGTADKVNILNWYTNTSNHIDEIVAGDGKVITDEKVQSLVDVMATLQAPVYGETHLSIDQLQLLAPKLHDAWI